MDTTYGRYFTFPSTKAAWVSSNINYMIDRVRAVDKMFDNVLHDHTLYIRSSRVDSGVSNIDSPS